MSDSSYLFFIFIVIIFTILILQIWNSYRTSPFNPPVFKKTFDVTGKRNPDIEEFVDLYLIENGIRKVYQQKNALEVWKENNEEKVFNSVFRRKREEQFYDAITTAEKYMFYFSREQTRYQQVNYVRSSYKVNHIVEAYSVSFDYLIDRHEKLERINFETTLKQFQNKNQRKLMTKDLRKMIMERDNYTCQICGKYMPDGIGLQIDHIIPISKGGKTIPSNLQVLCSRCNGRKSNK